MGCGFQMGEQGYNIGRNAALLAGHRPSRPGHDGQPLLRLLAADDPDGLPRDQGRRGRPVHRRRRRGRLALPRARRRSSPHPQLDGSEGSPYNVYIPMGLTAENVAERCKVSREAQDEWAVIVAEPRGRRARLRPLRRRDRRRSRADGTEVTRDDGPRPGTTMEKLAELKPAFKPENGTVTAGNACPLNDGAAAVLVMSEEQAKELGLKPKARIVASSVAAIRPEIMGLGPIPAVEKVLEQAGHDDRRHRRGRAQRGVRRPGRARAARSGASTPRSSTRSAARSPSATRSA